MAVATQVNPLQDTEITGKTTDNKAVSPRVAGKSAFDLRRQKISAEEAKSKQRQRDALKRRNVVQGISGGVAAKQSRLADVEARKIEASRKGEVDIQELLAAERDKAAQAQRQFQTGERVGTQGFTAQQEALRRAAGIAEAQKEREFRTGERVGSQEFQSGETAAERQARIAEAEKQRLFQTGERVGSQEFQSGETAAERMAAEQEAERQRLFQQSAQQSAQQFESAEAAKERISRETYEQAQLSFREQELAQNADQFRDKQQFDQWAIQSGYDENEAARAWQAQEAVKDKEFATAQAKTQQEFSKDLASLNQELQQGTMTFAQELQDQAKLTETKADAAYNLGKSGGPMPDGFNSYEKAAYLSGQAGESVEQHQANKQALIDYRNALITTLDPTSPTFVQGLNNIMKKTNAFGSGGGLVGSQEHQILTTGNTLPVGFSLTGGKDGPSGVF